MMYDCKHCGKKVVRDEGGRLWLDAGHSHIDMHGTQQYCWIDPLHGSQLHEADVTGQQEIWLVATFQGEEVARLYIAEYTNEEELDVYSRNGSPRRDALARILPYGCTYAYVKVNKPAAKTGRTELVDE